MRKVFLVEHNPTFREWCRLHLSTEGLAVVPFDREARAWEATRLESVDLLVISTDLPDGGAFALAATVRSNVRTALIPILFLVPEDDPVARAQALSVEPTGVATKPLSRSALLDAVVARIKGTRGADNPLRSYAAHHSGEFEMPLGNVASGPLLEARRASVLVVSLRNFVSMARALNAHRLDRILGRFAALSRQAVFEQAGWVVRADMLTMIGLFEDAPHLDVSDAARALEAALRIVLAARSTKQWAQTELGDMAVPALSVGCGVHSGEVVLARLSMNGHIAPSVAGQPVECASRLEGRAKGLQWSIATSGATFARSGVRFLEGRRTSLTIDAQTIAVIEVSGLNAGAVKPDDLPLVAELREAVLANNLLARLADGVDQSAGDVAVITPSKRAEGDEPPPHLPDRRIERLLTQGKLVKTYLTVHEASGRKEIAKTCRLRGFSSALAEQYVAAYSALAALEQRNIADVYVTGKTAEVGFAVLEFIPGRSLADAVRRALPLGTTLNCLAQACLALDAIHGAGIVHGHLRPEHFLFRQDGVVVLTDFAVTERILRTIQLSSARDAPPRLVPALTPRADFKALGRILHALLTTDTRLINTAAVTLTTEQLAKTSRLPLPLSPLQTCLDALLGIGPLPPIDKGEDVLLALLAMKDVFPFDIGPVDADGTLPRRLNSPGRA